MTTNNMITMADLNIDRFWSKVEKTETCWNWLAGKFLRGYGAFWCNGRNVGAHIFSYNIFIGEIPKGLVLDHLCRNTSCVNPNHLEPVTDKENLRRGFSPSAINSNKTHCINGHILEGSNLYIKPNGARNCRTCRNNAARMYEEKNWL